MSSALFYQEIIDNNYLFENELLQWLKFTFSATNVFDVDSQTDLFIFDSILTVLKDSNLSLIVLNCQYKTPVSNLMPLMEEIWKQPSKYHVMVSGENPSVIKMLKLCEHVHMNLNVESQKELITSLLPEN